MTRERAAMLLRQAAKMIEGQATLIERNMPDVFAKPYAPGESPDGWIADAKGIVVTVNLATYPDDTSSFSFGLKPMTPEKHASMQEKAEAMMESGRKQQEEAFAWVKDELAHMEAEKGALPWVESPLVDEAWMAVLQEDGNGEVMEGYFAYFDDAEERPRAYYLLKREDGSTEVYEDLSENLKAVHEGIERCETHHRDRNGQGSE